MRREPLYNSHTPFLKDMAASVSSMDRAWAIEWAMKEVEKPIRRLRKKYPEYSTPEDCKRLGELYLAGKVNKEQMNAALSDLDREAGYLDIIDRESSAFAESVAEGVMVIRTKRHIIRFVGYYLTALKIAGASDREIEREAERMASSCKKP